ncbi:MAG: sulfite exporter TauE/SafE family protein [Solirubrobacteraceae bacterium]|nr:sulfite exporter TauE/SafE family protein [Solirubrobacteraceae bacterium]
MIVLATAIDHSTLLIVAGFLAGVLGGLVGIGGGILAVPALVYAAGLGQREAIATSLAAIVPMSIAGTYRQHRYGNVNVREGLGLGMLGILGAFVGATLADVLPDRVLRIGFGLLMLVIAAQLVQGVRRGRRTTTADPAG